MFYKINSEKYVFSRKMKPKHRQCFTESFKFQGFVRILLFVFRRWHAPRKKAAPGWIKKNARTPMLRNGACHHPSIYSATRFVILDCYTLSNLKFWSNNKTRSNISSKTKQQKLKTGELVGWWDHFKAFYMKLTIQS